MTLFLQDLIEHNLSHHIFFLHFFKNVITVFLYCEFLCCMYRDFNVTVYINFIKIHVIKKQQMRLKNTMNYIHRLIYYCRLDSLAFY